MDGKRGEGLERRGVGGSGGCNVQRHMHNYVACAFCRLLSFLFISFLRRASTLLFLLLVLSILLVLFRPFWRQLAHCRATI